MQISLQHRRPARHLTVLATSCLAAVLLLLAMVGLGWWYLLMVAGCAICLLPAAPSLLREWRESHRRWPGRIPGCGLRR